jgi:hypothetical protein
MLGKRRENIPSFWSHSFISHSILSIVYHNLLNKSFRFYFRYHYVLQHRNDNVYISIVLLFVVSVTRVNL